MRVPYLSTAFFLLGVASMLKADPAGAPAPVAPPAQTTPAAGDLPKKPATPRPAARAPAPAPGSLPGKGLTGHNFLYTGEWDVRPNVHVQTIFLIRDGKVAWTYSIPTYTAPTPDHPKGDLSEFDDIHLLSNGNVLYAAKTSVTEITSDKKIVWNYDCPKGTECHSAQPIGLDKVFLCLNGLPARALLINIKTGQVEMEHELPIKSPNDPKSIHGEFRHIRMTKAGTYLIAALGLGKVIEYDKDWKEIWSCPAPSAWAAVRLKNGNTLISGNQNGYVREVNPKGEIVWEINKDDLPGIPLYTVQEVDRLANGNTIICNWGGSIRKEDWDKVVQLIEVTPDKKVAWALYQWANPDLGPSSCFQTLDEPGKDEDGDLQR
ncbi:MAG TPA: hypothetical protein VK717_03425 [Opitutaceae bacterium]|jgi:hypothetical protein|nr:hypothetical protein [Opitutaceae bacterium]